MQADAMYCFIDKPDFIYTRQFGTDLILRVFLARWDNFLTKDKINHIFAVKESYERCL